MKILNFGSLNLDHVYSVDHIVTQKETITSYSLDHFCGGKGLIGAIALARAGMQVYMAGQIGKDGRELLDVLKDDLIHTDFVREIDGNTGHAIIQVDRSGQNSIITYGGANKCITRDFIDEVLSHFDEGDYILLQNEINNIPYIIDRAYEKKMKIVLNPSPYNEDLGLCDFDKVEMFIMNEIEGRMMTGEGRPQDMIDNIHKRYPKASVLLTLGSSGAVFFNTSYLYKTQIYRVPTVDPTAAGDCFLGFFLASYLNGESIREALDIAARSAALCVMKMGAANSIPTLSEVMNYRF